MGRRAFRDGGGRRCRRPPSTGSAAARLPAPERRRQSRDPKRLPRTGHDHGVVRQRHDKAGFEGLARRARELPFEPSTRERGVNAAFCSTQIVCDPWTPCVGSSVPEAFRSIPTSFVSLSLLGIAGLTACSGGSATTAPVPPTPPVPVDTGPPIDSARDERPVDRDGRQHRLAVALDAHRPTSSARSSTTFSTAPRMRASTRCSSTFGRRPMRCTAPPSSRGARCSPGRRDRIRATIR